MDTNRLFKHIKYNLHHNADIDDQALPGVFAAGGMEAPTEGKLKSWRSGEKNRHFLVMHYSVLNCFIDGVKRLSEKDSKVRNALIMANETLPDSGLSDKDQEEARTLLLLD